MKKAKYIIGLSLFFSFLNAQELSETEVESDSLSYEEWNDEQYEILDQVIITGVSRMTKMRENPISTVRISSEQLDLSSNNNVIDALVAYTPGLNVVKTGPNISKPFIRGLGYNRVLTLYDGIRQEDHQWGEEHGLSVDDYSVSLAEVIKGPASLMYGSDALAGVVSLYPEIPKYTGKNIRGRMVNEFQTNHGMIGNGFSLGYNDDVILFALRASNRMAKNYQNPIDNRVYLTNYKVTNFSALAGYKYNKGYTHLNFTYYDNKQGIPDGSRDAESREFTKQIHEEDEDDLSTRPIVTKGELNSYRIPVISQRIQHSRIYLTSFYELNQGNLDFKLAYQRNIRREFNHPTLPDQAGMYLILNTINYSFKYETPIFSNVETSFGFNGMYQDNENLDGTDFTIPDYNLFDIGAFAFARWKGGNWTISGGFRYDRRMQKWDDFYVGINPETGFDQISDENDADADLMFPSFKKNFHDWSGSLGATYRVSDEVSLKANIGRAFRAPNITELASNGLDPGARIIYLGDRSFDPEVSVQQDVGLIGSFRDFSTEISFFHNYIDNFIYLNAVSDEDGELLIDNQGNRTYRYQQTDAQLYGGELWFSIHPRNLKNFRFDNSISMVYGLNRDSKFKNKGVEGKYLPLIAPLNLISTMSYEIGFNSKILNSITPKIGMEHSARQNRYFGLNNTETETPEYTLFNAGFSMDLNYNKSNKIQLVFHVNNLFDKAYQSHLSRLKYMEEHENGNGIYDMGRNITFKIITSF